MRVRWLRMQFAESPCLSGRRFHSALQRGRQHPRKVQRRRYIPAQIRDRLPRGGIEYIELCCELLFLLHLRLP